MPILPEYEIRHGGNEGDEATWSKEGTLPFLPEFEFLGWRGALYGGAGCRFCRKSRLPRWRLPILPEIAFSRLANRSPLPAVAVFAGIRIFA
ncbi:MAG TPA: hypothetical protein VKQ30_24640 [Ktedonobacterales bacterium]|nr:hypothetical protein [Ktedonobacterales bacterium]